MISLQAERGGLRDVIALELEYGGMEQLVEPKQEINEDVRLVCWWGEGTLQERSRERAEACLILLHMLCLLWELLLFQVTPRGTGDRSYCCSLIFVLEEKYV